MGCDGRAADGSAVAGGGGGGVSQPMRRGRARTKPQQGKLHKHPQPLAPSDAT